MFRPFVSYPIVSTETLTESKKIYLKITKTKQLKRTERAVMVDASSFPSISVCKRKRSVGLMRVSLRTKAPKSKIKIGQRKSNKKISFIGNRNLCIPNTSTEAPGSNVPKTGLTENLAGALVLNL